MQPNKRISTTCLLFLASMPSATMPAAFGFDDPWKAAMLREAKVPFGRIQPDGAISREGNFQDEKRIYRVLDERPESVFLYDGSKAGWVLKSKLIPTEPEKIEAPDFPNLADVQVSAAMPHYGMLGNYVLYDERATFMVGKEIIDKEKSIGYPAPVEGIHGEWLWLGRGWVKRSEVWNAEEGLAKYSVEIQSDPSNATAWYGRAKSWELRKDWKYAIKDYTRAMGLDPKMAKAYSGRASSKIALADLEGAIADCEEAIRIDPNLVDAYLTQATAMSQRGMHAQAISLLDRSAQIDPKSPQMYIARGRIKTLGGQPVAAIEDFDKAIELDPLSDTAYIDRGNIKFDLKDFEGALRDQNAALQIDPSNSISYNNRGNSKQYLKDYAGAIEDRDQAIRLNPRYGIAFRNRSLTKILMRQYEEAIQDLQDALRFEPEMTNAMSSLAFLLATIPNESMRDAKKGMELVDRALGVDPKEVYALTAKACLLALQGDFPKAIQMQEQALQIPSYAADTDFDGGRYAEERIASWREGKLWMLPLPSSSQ